jgi:hypothetical protein
MTHRLQETWFDAAVEQGYIAKITAMIEAGKLEAAQARLLADIADIGSTLSPICAELPDKIILDGWNDLSEVISEYEGDEPITAVHCLLYNPPDLAFEDRDTIFQPELDVALYSDAQYAFSQSNRDALFAEIQLPDRPWYGQGEDIEAYLELNGMGQFNTLLLRHKRQYHFRDQQHTLDALNGENPDLVPLLYIEFVMCALLRAVLFHQVIKAKVDSDGLPGNVPVIVSMDNMKFDIANVYMPKKRIEKAAVKPVADLVIPIKRAVLTHPEEVPVVSVRQRVIEQAAANAEAEKPGFFRRLFGFGKKAA